MRGSFARCYSEVRDHPLLIERRSLVKVRLTCICCRSHVSREDIDTSLGSPVPIPRSCTFSIYDELVLSPTGTSTTGYLSLPLFLSHYFPVSPCQTQRSFLMFARFPDLTKISFPLPFGDMPPPSFLPRPDPRSALQTQVHNSTPSSQVPLGAHLCKFWCHRSSVLAAGVGSQAVLKSLVRLGNVTRWATRILDSVIIVTPPTPTSVGLVHI